MQNIKFSQSQKKIITISLLVVVVFLVFLFFIYLPSRDTVIKIKSELLSCENQIQEIKTIVSGVKSQGEGIRILKEKLKGLDNKFPSKEEEASKMLSALARKVNIEIISVKLESKKELIDENNNKIGIEEKTCQSILVSMEIKCPYKDLISYIRALKESLPALVTVEALRISKDGPQPLTLNVTLTLNLYILS